MTLGRTRISLHKSTVRIIREVGRGGMGIVYEAEDTLLKRKVAIKLLPKEVSSNPEALTRFLREAQGAARPATSSLPTWFLPASA